MTGRPLRAARTALAVARDLLWFATATLHIAEILVERWDADERSSDSSDRP